MRAKAKGKLFLGLAAGLLWMTVPGEDAQAAEGGRVVPHYDIRETDGDWDGTNFFLPDGAKVTDAFFCDGEYTYYLMADGSPMKNRLTYHPDGEHIIYLDEEGHEVFSNFTHVSQSIAGDPVDDLCFFDVNGYMYVDVLTYDQTGEHLYYANPYGVMERNGWFRFSRNVSIPWGDNNEQVARGYGYAGENGALMTDQYTYDVDGNLVYMEGDGHARGTSSAESGFEANNLQCNAQEHVDYNYITPYYSYPEDKVVGKLSFFNYKILELSEEEKLLYPGKEGYEWRNVSVVIVYEGDRVGEDGVTFAWSTTDYYDYTPTEIHKQIIEDDENVLNTFTVDYNGEDAECVIFYEGWLEWADSFTCLGHANFRFLVPKGYDGVVVSFYDQELSTLKESIQKRLENGINFRLQ